jgi:hypothetical protein
MKQVSSLSHVILEDMLSWNAPISVADIRSLLGLVGYY